MIWLKPEASALAFPLWIYMDVYDLVGSQILLVNLQTYAAHWYTRFASNLFSMTTWHLQGYHDIFVGLKQINGPTQFCANKSYYGSIQGTYINSLVGTFEIAAMLFSNSYW